MEPKSWPKSPIKHSAGIRPKTGRKSAYLGLSRVYRSVVQS